MSERYYHAPPVSERVTLGDSEAHHLIHVMRAKTGAELTLFDGQGTEYTARIDRVARAEVELTVLESRAIDRELPFQLTLGVALPKGDRQKWLVEKIVELGVSRLVPLETARSVAQPVENAIDRLRRSVIEASKQCRRNRLMEITAPRPWREFVQQDPTAIRWVAHPTANSIAAGGNRPIPAGGICMAAVGPEGGFSEEEVGLALTAGWQPLDLGPRILRVETAAIALAAIMAQWGRKAPAQVD